MPNNLPHLPIIIQQFGEHMRMNFSHRNRPHANIDRFAIFKNSASNNRSKLARNMHFLATAFLMKFEQSRMLVLRRPMLVIPRRMNPMPTTAKAALISMKPGIFRVDDDVPP